MSPEAIADLVERTRENELRLDSAKKRIGAAASVAAGRARQARGEPYHGVNADRCKFGGRKFRSKRGAR
jgi:hypothetical protein